MKTQEERINAVKTYLKKIDLTCGEDLYQVDAISSDVHNNFDTVLTLLFGKDYDLCSGESEE